MAEKQTKRAQRDATCRECADLGFVRMGKEVVPCPKCNPDGQEIEGEAS